MHINNAIPPAYAPYHLTECPMFTDIGYGTIRLWDGYVVHRILNPSNGVYSWEGMDYRVQKALDAGLEIIYTFGAMPDWATTSPGPFPNYNPYPPTNLAYLTTFVTALVTRYAGKIKYYELWNEVDSAGSWVGTVDQMVANSQVIYPAVKAADPNAIVLSPNTISWGSLNLLTGLGYLDRFLSTGSAYCDAIACHFYTDPSQPETYISVAKAYKNLAKKYGKTSIVCTETGVSRYYSSTGTILNPRVNGAGEMMSEQQAASWVARMLICGWIGGAESLCYYLLDNVQNVMAINMTDYNPSGAVATAVYQPMLAFKFVSTTLTGGTISGYKQRGNFCQADFSVSDGRTGKIVWCLDYKTQTYDLTGNTSAFTCIGSPVSIVSNYTLTNTPIFVFK